MKFKPDLIPPFLFIITFLEKKGGSWKNLLLIMVHKKFNKGEVFI